VGTLVAPEAASSTGDGPDDDLQLDDTKLEIERRI